MRLFRPQGRATIPGMSEPDEEPRRYKWPWFVLAAVLLFIVLTIVWMSLAVKRERQERDMNAPIPTGTK